MKDQQITITMSYDEWWTIWTEAYGHLCYYGEDDESVNKLGDILNEYKENNSK